jgi:hypothetical protein
MKKLAVLFLILAFPFMMQAQGTLIGNWKYASSGEEMTMRISPGTIVINGQSFSYKAQDNVLMIQEGTITTSYPYKLSGNQLTLEFPGGMELVFMRINAGTTTPGGQPNQGNSGVSGSTGPGQQASTFSGKWEYKNPQGQLILEFISNSELTLNGETAKYQLKAGIIQAAGEYGWIDYPYTLSKGTLTITFPDGSVIPFNRASTATATQQGISTQRAGGGSTWQLKGALCSWSGSSNSSSSYSSTQKIVFDGQGNFQYGRESSFSGNAGIAYSGNPNVKTGTYNIGESVVTLHFQDGDTYQVKINMRQDNGMITELMYNGTLYAKGLCE